VREFGGEPAQVRFSVQTTPAAPIELDGLDLEPLPPALETLRFDVKLDAHDTGPTLRLQLGLADDLFDPGTAGRLADELAALVHERAHCPDDPVALP
jgi:hypothetical protein